ncbi:response regulator [Natranaerofaba carboxydovora]|uniref:response regulator n=1 Tax=Natranaerofaba carboxydovora TaxID=2742683 RepID=UPI001F132683|nr:response regulator transcription factor [Natranaerofaba carboxydovora]UMZ74352.1 Transcriptional regulatory protein DegU [Natranaerofaba carboxydovora]
MKNSTKVLLVEDHGIVRNGLKLILDLDDSIEVCGEVGTLNEAMGSIEENAPDVILLDFKLPDADGIIGCGNIKKMFPEIKVIILTAYADRHIVTETIKAGAEGYLLKNIDSDELIKTIKQVQEGKVVLDPSVTKNVINDLKTKDVKNRISSKLSPKEVEILQMISVGKANKEIGEALDISDKTVRNYVSSILRKLNVSNRTEAASYWVRSRSLDSD